MPKARAIAQLFRTTPDPRAYLEMDAARIINPSSAAALAQRNGAAGSGGMPQSAAPPPTPRAPEPVRPVTEAQAEARAARNGASYSDIFFEMSTQLRNAELHAREVAGGNLELRREVDRLRTENFRLLERVRSMEARFATELARRDNPEPEGAATASQPEAAPITPVPAPMTPPTLPTALGVQEQLGSPAPDSEFFGSGSSAEAEPAFKPDSG